MNIAEQTTRECRVCGVELNDDNWAPAGQKNYNYICKECGLEQDYSWRKNNPEKEKARRTRNARKKGHLPMSENKKCSSYLGVYVNERLLKHYFDDVEVMPYGNPGYDFVCNKGYKVDAKSSCMRKNGGWVFIINHNTTADYFMLVAYDNRDDLNPIHVWLIPGHVLNHLTGTSIRPSTLDKWAEYEKPIDDVVLCCDTIKGE